MYVILMQQISVCLCSTGSCSKGWSQAHCIQEEAALLDSEKVAPRCPAGLNCDHLALYDGTLQLCRAASDEACVCIVHNKCMSSWLALPARLQQLLYEHPTLVEASRISLLTPALHQETLSLILTVGSQALLIAGGGVAGGARLQLVVKAAQREQQQLCSDVEEKAGRVRRPKVAVGALFARRLGKILQM